MCHSLNCKKGGLFIERHNKLCDRVAELAGKAFAPTHVHDNLLIFSGCVVQKTKAQPTGYTHPPSKNKSEATEQKDELLIHDLYHNGTDSVHGMRVVKTYAK